MIEAAGSGFLIAVLWMDLIFDVQVLRHRRSADLPEPVLASIAAYYHRATTTSRPMSLLIAAVMAILLVALIFDDFHGGVPTWLMALFAVLAGGPVLTCVGAYRPARSGAGASARDAGPTVAPRPVHLPRPSAVPDRHVSVPGALAVDQLGRTFGRHRPLRDDYVWLHT
ncbi:hypothetical protein MAUB1S_02787 [Mycolicibacterium aubagnense]